MILRNIFSSFSEKSGNMLSMEYLINLGNSLNTSFFSLSGYPRYIIIPDLLTSILQSILITINKKYELIYSNGGSGDLRLVYKLNSDFIAIIDLLIIAPFLETPRNNETSEINNYTEYLSYEIISSVDLQDLEDPDKLYNLSENQIMHTGELDIHDIHYLSDIFNYFANYDEETFDISSYNQFITDENNIPIIDSRFVSSRGNKRSYFK
jgi:hypothetical protein